MQNPLRNIIHIVKQMGLDILLPSSCAGCGRQKEAFCASCREASYKYGAGCLYCGLRNQTGLLCPKCRRIKNLSNVLWAGRYFGPLKEAIGQLKYKRRTELAAPLGGMLYKKFLEIHPDYKKERFIIIPLPLSYEKEKARGFNQAELLAKEFSGISRISLLTHSLLKIKETPAQVEVKEKDKRIKNLEGAFLADPKKLMAYGVQHKAVILIDDVATTGATLEHASGALAQAGAQKIIGLVVAHGG